MDILQRYSYANIINNACLRKACQQMKAVDRQLTAARRRYSRAQQSGSSTFEKMLATRIAVLEGVRSMYHAYACVTTRDDVMRHVTFLDDDGVADSSAEEICV